MSTLPCLHPSTSHSSNIKPHAEIVCNLVVPLTFQATNLWLMGNFFPTLTSPSSFNHNQNKYKTSSQHGYLHIDIGAVQFVDD